MKQARIAWTVYGACLAVLLAALAWAGMQVLSLTRDEESAELARLALWRMEYAIGTLVNQEAGRPYHEYFALATPELTDATRSLRPPEPAVATERCIPSPLLSGFVDFTLLHFVYGVEEKLSSPQVPERWSRGFCIDHHFADERQLEAAANRLAALQEILRLHPLKRMWISVERAEGAAKGAGALSNLSHGDSVSLELSNNEWNARRHQFETSQFALNAQQNAGVPPAMPPRVEEGMLRGVFCGDALLLVRHANIDSRPVLQGCWLDERALQDRLLADISDLLPNARLERRAEGQPRESEAALALVALPFRLVPGPIAAAAAEKSSAARSSLYVAIGAVLLAALAVGVLLQVVLAFSERRAAFVSAVTHELRTPLTTLRMYAELLAEGRVKGEDKQQRYFETLRQEADRLFHLVDNVLSFSRIEASPAQAQREPVALKSLLEECTSRARERAEQAGMTLEIADASALDGAAVAADVSAVEQIVFNLVDNACKYASEAADRRVILSAEVGDGRARIAVRDFGPGISADEARRLFKPFERSRAVAMRGKPGVGLGLALCRRLARAMGGELRWRPQEGGGARFELELRRES